MFGEREPPRPADIDKLMVVRLAQEFGWTLDYIRSLSYSEREMINAVLTAQRKHKIWRDSKKKPAAKPRAARRPRRGRRR